MILQMKGRREMEQDSKGDGRLLTSTESGPDTGLKRALGEDPMKIPEQCQSLRVLKGSSISAATRVL